jgi:hypothetical protein
MNNNANPAERGPGELALFAIGFVGFIIGVAGVLLATIPVAVVGGIILLFVFSCFALASAD